MSDLDPAATISPADLARAKRERILAVSRTVHQVPVEEGGMLRRPAPVAAVASDPETDAHFWRRAALAAGGVASLAVGFAAGLAFHRRR
ncbi:hypothetical protein GCM10022280_02880 [Sphingomonas swuensis]|uniref:DUF3618 domain-containing protein n=1 Tax=Sphingomonas swuensis TaxID=977800 RepID=A0ABP7SBP1_9SPHN